MSAIKIVLEVKERGREKNDKTSDAKAITRHLTQEDRYSDSVWATAASPKTPSSQFLFLIKTLRGTEYMSFLPSPSLPAAEVECKIENVSSLCKHCSAAAKMLVCYQHSFNHKSKAQQHVGCYEYNELHPNQTQCNQ